MISPAFAQDGGAASPGGAAGFASLLPMVLIFAVFYFLLIRPQQKQQKQHRQMVADAKRGDQVVTSSGLYGKIAAIDDTNNIVMLEVSDKLQLKMDKNFIQTIIGYKSEEKKS